MIKVKEVLENACQKIRLEGTFLEYKFIFKKCKNFTQIADNVVQAEKT